MENPFTGIVWSEPTDMAGEIFIATDVGSGDDIHSEVTMKLRKDGVMEIIDSQIIKRNGKNIRNTQLPRD